METAYKLHYAPDNASLIIRLTLDEMQVPFETVLVDRAHQGQKSPEYLALNPNGLIPVLETPDGALFETGAILLWLADHHGKMAPAPNAPTRGAFLKWLFFVSNTLHADLRTTFYPQFYVGTNTTAQNALITTQQARLKQHLHLLDDLAEHGPDWLTGNAPSVLCYYVAGLMRWMALYPASADRSWFSPDDYPHLLHILRGLERRPAVLSAQSAEGLGPTPFTAPTHATPPEGTAT